MIHDDRILLWELTKLRAPIKEKRRGKLTQGVLLLYGNLPSQRRSVAMAAVPKEAFELLERLPYSLNLAPSDYRPYLKLKEQPRGNRFLSNNEVIGAADA